ncbi:MAG: FGGY-family carbohydrate kinase [Chloroflexi bacterium]|nr:FGGY-family carbohydrate kinase [Chloroflexota bacterium]
MSVRPRELLLGIDIGTSGSKGVLASPAGRIVAVASRPHPLSLPRPGWAEHDAETIWWADFLTLSHELVARAGESASRIVGLCVSGIGPTLLPADADGRPLRPAILYGIDSRSTREIADLTERFGADAILVRGGTLLSSQAVGPKLLWLRRHEPRVWAETRQLLMANSFVVQRLTGEYVLDHHSASQVDPLYEVQHQRWAEDWASEVAPGLQLPRLVWPAETVGAVTAAAAAETGLPAGVPVAAGSIDAWVEALSVDVRDPGDVMFMYGTTLMVVQVVDRLVPYPGLWGTTHVFPGASSLSTGLATSGALTSWLREIAGGIPYEQLLGEASGVPAGADGLLVLPYFAGERAPIDDPHARGMILGLTLSHGRGHLYRALLEASGYGVRHIMDTLRAAAAHPRRLVAVGGGTQGDLWPQIVSDILGQPQEIPRETIGAAYGDALLAAIAAGLADQHTRWNQPAATIEPNGQHTATYDRLYEVYRSLYPATREQMHQLAAFQLG